MNTREPFETVEEIIQYGSPVYIVYVGEYKLIAGWGVFELQDKNNNLWFKNWSEYLFNEADYGKAWTCYPYFCEKESEMMEEN